MVNDSNILEKIKILREKLDSNLDNEELCSEKTLSLSREVDDLILEFYRLDGKTKILK